MEILKKSIIALCAIVSFAFNTAAQSAEETQKAFKASYSNEYKSNYPNGNKLVAFETKGQIKIQPFTPFRK